MFGYVSVHQKELTDEQKNRYGSIYCGICRCIREQASQMSALCLSYDMAFLALLLMSLYEPEEVSHPNACLLHPIKKRPWVDNPYVRYAADMNVALTYYKCLDDWQDDHAHAARLMANHLQPHMETLQRQYPRQCGSIAECIRELSALESENCQNPDEPANCFGKLMAELMVYREDLWSEKLRQLGFYLGRFIYLADAVTDYPGDLKKKKYNPLQTCPKERWEDYLVLAMGSCTQVYERLPLVQDKGILDNILYSGIWTKIRKENGNERV
jgi:hypothetical protein